LVFIAALACGVIAVPMVAQVSAWVSSLVVTDQLPILVNKIWFLF